MQILSVLMSLVLCAIIIMNFQDNIAISIVSEQFSQLLNIPVFSKSVNTAVFALILFVLGELSAIFFFAPLYWSLKEKFNAYKRELEKGSVSNTSNNAKIQILENKIAVLEKALNDALNNQN